MWLLMSVWSTQCALRILGGLLQAVPAVDWVQTLTTLEATWSQWLLGTEYTTEYTTLYYVGY